MLVKQRDVRWWSLFVRILCYYSHFSLVDFELSAAAHMKSSRMLGCVAAFWAMKNKILLNELLCSILWI